MISLEVTKEGLILQVKASAGSRQDAITGVYDGALKVSVRQAPEKGKANEAIIKVMAACLGIKKNQLELRSGQTSSHKKFLVQGISAEALQTKLDKILNDPK